jgi:peptidoglycan/LPS O-acetylase OafA/YrhL
MTTAALQRVLERTTPDRATVRRRTTGRHRARLLTMLLGRRTQRFRSDVEGLRAVAVLAVVAYHAGLPFAPGGYVGVDVFFVISGFLITGQLVRDLEVRGRLSLLAFYARRVRRLLPLSLVVLASTVATGALLLDALRARALVLDALAALGYGLNWRLALQGTDYLTATAAPSALQHYWSLGVEEQFYALWPLLLLLGVGVGRRSADLRSRRRRLALVLTLVVVASLAASALGTARSQPWAYFGLHTRAWELAAGGLAALGADRLARLGGGRAATLTWSGLSMVVLSVVAYDDTTAFPGLAATVPAFGAVLVVGAGCRRPVGGAEAFLGRPSMQVVGALSYGWYLWHWPVLLLAPSAMGQDLSPRARVLVTLLALPLAAVTYRLVEHPARAMTWPVRLPWRAVGTGLAASAAAAVLVLATLVALPDARGRGTSQEVELLAAHRDPAARVAEAVDEALTARPVPANLTPALADVRAATSLPLPQRDSCHSDFADRRSRTDCVYGDSTADRTIVLFGDSHALQWFPALEALATRQRHRLVDVTKSSCTPMSLTIWNETLRRPYTECDTWRRDAIRRIRALRPDLVVVSTLTGTGAHGLYGRGAGFDAAWAKATSRTVAQLRTGGARVAVLGDTVLPSRQVPECLAEHLDDASACSFYRAGGIEPLARRTAQAASARAAGALVVDPVPWLCGQRQCPTVVGNLLVYRDDQHLSTAYSAWLAPVLGNALGL